MSAAEEQPVADDRLPEPVEASLAKSDPFRLRGEPPSVMRLSRKTLAIAGALAGTAIGGALLWALQPADKKAPENLYVAEGTNKPDTVTGAPADYGAIPKLGPPLPGDLGRPILSAQQEGQLPPVPPPPGQARAPDPALDARDRAREERESANASRLFLAGGAASRGPALDAEIEPSAAGQGNPTDSAPTAGRRSFMAAGDRAEESTAPIRAASSPYLLQAGSVIPAAMVTGIQSDLPGQVIAQVTENVYDSPTGRILLIPQGARLIGEYDSEVAAGQNRVLLGWDRLLFADGRSVSLERLPGADARGMAGLSDRTDNHWGHMIRAALVTSLLGAGAEIGSGDDDRLVRALRRGPQDGVSEVGQRLVDRQLRIPPTLTVRPGFPLRVLVTRDLILEPADGVGR
ncbi:TrbI/VirB10 family protein [Sphingopyxis sp. JAI108]|uniref:TrbI/VirB10 family protein n=1 Tax=Sphingopyxis sp. JAI108 TaxID=2723060 RepID=UPI0015CCCD45|nr:TrbI/VirB10 family protein [Sphingopyxis sp. JAI108]NYF32520.1 type IV secretion system protein VirB10 [Sphingopyxis sp. JAI108]